MNTQLLTDQAIAAANYYLQYQGQKGTAKQVSTLLKQLPGDTIIRMARERGYNQVIIPGTATQIAVYENAPVHALTTK